MYNAGRFLPEVRNEEILSSPMDGDTSRDFARNPSRVATPQPQQSAADSCALPPQTPPTTQAPTAPQTQAPTNRTRRSPLISPVPQTENPNVKPGSEADVNAIGNRNVGQGPGFLFARARNRAGQAARAGSGEEREVHRRSGCHRIREPRGPEPGAQFGRAAFPSRSR